jgi:transposase
MRSPNPKGRKKAPKEGERQKEQKPKRKPDEARRANLATRGPHQMGGRPTLYRPEYCDRVIEFMQQGYSLIGFAGEIGVSYDATRNWELAYPEFADAVKIARAKASRWWEERCRDLATGKGGGAPGRATAIIFGLKNRCKEEWRDLVHTSSELNVNVAVTDARGSVANKLGKIAAVQNLVAANAA